MLYTRPELVAAFARPAAPGTVAGGAPYWAPSLEKLLVGLEGYITAAAIVGRVADDVRSALMLGVYHAFNRMTTEQEAQTMVQAVLAVYDDRLPAGPASPSPRARLSRVEGTMLREEDRRRAAQLVHDEQKRYAVARLARASRDMDDTMFAIWSLENRFNPASERRMSTKPRLEDCFAMVPLFDEFHQRANSTAEEKRASYRQTARAARLAWLRAAVASLDDPRFWKLRYANDDVQAVTDVMRRLWLGEFLPAPLVVDRNRR
jgi:hypothetical protein